MKWFSLAAMVVLVSGCGLFNKDNSDTSDSTAATTTQVAAPTPTSSFKAVATVSGEIVSVTPLGTAFGIRDVIVLKNGNATCKVVCGNSPQFLQTNFVGVNPNTQLTAGTAITVDYTPCDNEDVCSDVPNGADFIAVNISQYSEIQDPNATPTPSPTPLTNPLGTWKEVTDNDTLTLTAAGGGTDTPRTGQPCNLTCAFNATTNVLTLTYAGATTANPGGTPNNPFCIPGGNYNLTFSATGMTATQGGYTLQFTKQ
jgi:hypothetical protein